MAANYGYIYILTHCHNTYLQTQCITLHYGYIHYVNTHITLCLLIHHTYTYRNYSKTHYKLMKKKKNKKCIYYKLMEKKNVYNLKYDNAKW